MTSDLTMRDLLSVLLQPGNRELPESGASRAEIGTVEAGYEAEERAAIQAEAAYPLPPEAEHERMVAGLLRAARAGEPDDWPELATTGAGCYAATRANPDGSVEVRQRLPDGSWGSPAYLPAPRAMGVAA